MRFSKEITVALAARLPTRKCDLSIIFPPPALLLRTSNIVCAIICSGGDAKHRQDLNLTIRSCYIGTSLSHYSNYVGRLGTYIKLETKVNLLASACH